MSLASGGGARPLSDHWNGQRFFNPASFFPGGARPERGARAVVRWRTQARERAKWPENIVDPPQPPPPATVEAGHAAITFIGHASFLIRLPGCVILTDPIFSDRCSPVSWAGPKRARPPGIALKTVPRPDLILLSHNHYDHMDFPSLRALQRLHAPRVATLLGNARALKKIGVEAAELDWWETLDVAGVRLAATPARHFSARTPFDRDRALWGGFMIEAHGGKILFAGDSGAGPHWGEIGRRLGPPDVALLPIGAYEPRWFMSAVHMNPAEAARAHLDLGARRSVGMHFGTFQLTDEAIDAPEQALAAARAEANLPADAFSTHAFGETRIYRLGDDGRAAGA